MKKRKATRRKNDPDVIVLPDGTFRLIAKRVSFEQTVRELGFTRADVRRVQKFLSDWGYPPESYAEQARAL